MKKSPRHAFTLIELLIALTLGIILTAVGTVSLSRFRSGQGLKLVVQEVSSALVSTRRRAVSQELSGAWGVRFLNGTSTKRYEVVSGSSYASGTVKQTSQIASGVTFSNPGTSTIDVWFSQLVGLASPQVISLVSGAQDGMVGDITVRGIGTVSSRVDTGLVGYWHLDESTGTIAYDASGLGNSGTLTNVPSRQGGINCKAGGCLNFVPASFQYVDIPDAISLKPTEAITVMGWIKPGLLNTREFLATKWNGFSVELNSSNQAVSSVYIDGIQRTTPASLALTNNTWTHLAFTYDSTSKTLNTYINGNQEIKSLVLSGLSTYSMSVSTNNLRIGSYSTYYWNGLIDEVKVYNRALSASEILNQYNELK